MAIPPPLVVPILATPFGVVSMPDGPALNQVLSALFTARMSADSAAGRNNPFCYVSKDDLLAWPEEPVKSLAEGMFRGIYSVVNAVNSFTDEELSAIVLEARGWFTIVEPDGYVAASQHALTSWCGIYCVAAPPLSPSRQDSGVLRFYESRLGTMFVDATTAAMRLPYTPGHHCWRPVPGQMAVFPASLTHEIALLRSAERLMLVTVRARFVAKGQQGVTRW
jgi:hypothetical protein